jgi:hypothetical protein
MSMMEAKAKRDASEIQRKEQASACKRFSPSMGYLMEGRLQST